MTYGFTIDNNNLSIPMSIYYKNKTVSLDSPNDIINTIKYFRKNNKNIINDLPNEIDSLNLLKSELEKHYDNYPTSLEEDIDSMKNLNFKKNFEKVNILRILIEEKKVIKLINYRS